MFYKHFYNQSNMILKLRLHEAKHQGYWSVLQEKYYFRLSFLKSQVKFIAISLVLIEKCAGTLRECVSMCMCKILKGSTLKH